MIVDTSVWVDVERGRLTHTEVASAVDNASVYLSPPVLAELEYGVQRAQTPDQRIRRANAVDRVRKKPCLIIDRQTGDLFGKLAAELDSRGTPSTHRVNDLWIAALAIQNNLKVLTGNAKDFEGIPGLTVQELRPSQLA